jgi:hypothetical protein
MITKNSIFVAVISDILMIGIIKKNLDGYYVDWSDTDGDGLEDEFLPSLKLEELEKNFTDCWIKSYERIGAILNDEKELLAFKLKFGHLK